MTNRFSEERTRARELLEQIDREWSPEGGQWVQWKSEMINLIRRVYGDESQQEKDFQRITFFAASISYVRPDEAKYKRELEATFREMLPKARGFLNAVMKDLEARSPSVSPSAIPRRYLWSSPVYWVEQMTTWLRLRSAWYWLKLHRVWSIIVTSITLTAAILAILRYLGVFKGTGE